MNLEEIFPRIWKDRNPLAYGLWPISMFYSTAVELRRLGYSSGLFAVEHFNFPTIVIGNLTVGGTGKTPLTIWAVNFLKECGYSPGVISRGYGRQDPWRSRMVTQDSTPEEVADEPLLIMRQTNAPVAVANKRSDAIRMLMRESDCDIIVSDDGLQHLSISTDLKVVLIDGQERFGNNFCLPAGPLRESSRHISAFDLVIVNGQGQANEYSMICSFTEAVNLLDKSQTRSMDSFVGENVTAVAGIRNPERFFDMLKQQGIESVNHPFADHHDFIPSEFEQIPTDRPVLMTEKDAVKCEQFAGPDWWYIGLEAKPEASFQEVFVRSVEKIMSRR